MSSSTFKISTYLFCLSTVCVLIFSIGCGKKGSMEPGKTYFMTATINGKAFQADSIDGGISDGALAVAGVRLSDTTTLTIGFDVSSIVLNKQTLFNDSTSLLTYLQGTNGDLYYISDSSKTATGNFIINSLDTINAVVSGSFSARMINQQGQSFNITNGSFKSHYVPFEDDDFGLRNQSKSIRFGLKPNTSKRIILK